MGDADKAIRIFQSVLDIMNKKHTKGLPPETARIMATLFIDRKQYKEALDAYGAMIEKAIRIKNTRLMPEIYLGFSSVYNAMGSFELALTYLYKTLDLFSPNYFDCGELLNRIMEQFEFAFNNLDKTSLSLKVSSILAGIRRLQNLGIDASSHEAHLAGEIREELNNFINTIKSDTIRIFSRDGIRVDLKTGEIFENRKVPKSILSGHQLVIFGLLVERQGGKPVSNTEIIGLYEEKASELLGIPRRAHYYIREIRKKLGKKALILTIKGAGYTIPKL
jgi:tetratricopeptide (TPR) repeat protein